MATPNFKRLTSKIYYVLHQEYMGLDDWIDVFTEDVSGMLSKDAEVSTSYCSDIVDGYNEIFYACTVSNEDMIDDVSIEVHVIICTLPGYYEGANADYIIRFEIAGDTIETLDETLEVLEYYEIKRAKSLSKKIIKKASAMHDELLKKVTDVLEKVTTPHICLGIASNGEAFYKQIKNEEYETVHNIS